MLTTILGQKFKIAKNDISVHPDFKIEEMLKAGNELLLVRLPEAATSYLEDKKVIIVKNILIYFSAKTALEETRW